MRKNGYSLKKCSKWVPGRKNDDPLMTNTCPADFIKIRGSSFFCPGTCLEHFFSKWPFFSHPLFFLKKNSDPLIFLLFFLDPLNFRHEIPSFQTPYFTIEKNFTPLISQAWKNSHPLFYIASTKNFAPLILHGKKSSLIPLKMAFQTLIFQKFVKGPDMIV